MRCRLDAPVLFVHRDDVPPYKKTGSTVRNSYFWALRAIADDARRYDDWAFDEVVWVALERMLTAFAMSGYLGYRETLLEFPPADRIPEMLRPVSTWAEEDAWV